MPVTISPSSFWLNARQEPALRRHNRLPIPICPESIRSSELRFVVGFVYLGRARGFASRALDVEDFVRAADDRK